MTAQALETGCFAEGRGAEAAEMVLGVADFAFEAGFATSAVVGVVFAGAAGLVAVWLDGLAATCGAAETIGASTTAFTSIGGGRAATGFAFGACVGVVATSGDVQRDSHQIAMLLEAATK
jgi:hypothetical protein